MQSDDDRHKQQEKKLQRMKECQWQSGKYGMLSLVLGGSVSFAVLKVLPSGAVAKNNIPLFSLGCAAAIGWITSVMVMRSCRKNQKLVADIASGLHSSSTKVDSKPNKYGDQNFFQEEKK